MASQIPRRKTYEEVFPVTLQASDTPPIYNTIEENHIAPFYALGWTFSEREIRLHFNAQSEWDKTLSPMSDSQTAWVNPRWRPYAKELPHYHRPLLHFMSNGDAIYQITINYPSRMETFKESQQAIIQAAIEVLRLSDDKASELMWYRSNP